MWGHGRSAWVERVGSGCGFDAGDGVSSEGGDGTGAHEGARRAGRTVDHGTALAGDLHHVAAKGKVSVVWTSIGEVEKKMTSNYFRFFILHEFLIPPFRCFANYCKQGILMIVSI